MQSRNQNIVNANVCYSLVLIYTRGEKRKKRREIKILNISVNTMKVIRLKSFSSSTGLTHTRATLLTECLHRRFLSRPDAHEDGLLHPVSSGKSPDCQNKL